MSRSFVNDLQDVRQEHYRLANDVLQTTDEVNSWFASAKARVATWTIRPITAADDAGPIARPKFRPCPRKYLR